MRELHKKARTDHPLYLKDGIKRIVVPDEYVSWEAEWAEYGELEQKPYTHSSVIEQYEKNGESGWASAPDTKALLTECRSYEKKLPSNAAGEVLNPRGRTGIRDGWGLLGRPGPNFAADPVILTIINEQLYVLLIKRRDTGEWAIPGWMVDYGEQITETLKRELREETGIDIDMRNSKLVYQGYVDDPRNTDKAWMETTVAVSFVDSDLEPQAGDDASDAVWRAVDESLFGNLYASHGEFLKQALLVAKSEFADNLEGVTLKL